MRGKSATHDVDAPLARTRLLEGLRNERKAFIYHCWNHYFCPVGFELTPPDPLDAYIASEEDPINLGYDTWIIIGEVSKCYPVFHSKRWADIVTDISCGFPEFFNIRKSELGIQKKETPSFQEGGSKAGGNLHCLIEFELT